ILAIELSCRLAPTTSYGPNGSALDRTITSGAAGSDTRSGSVRPPASCPRRILPKAKGWTERRHDAEAATHGRRCLAFGPGFRHIPPAGSPPISGPLVIHTRGTLSWLAARSGAAHGNPRGGTTGPQGKEHANGDARIHSASASGSRRPFRPPHPPLEPADGAVPLRRPQPGPYHRPAADSANAGPRA